MQQTNLNPIAPRKAKIAYNFSLSECNRVNEPNKMKRHVVIKEHLYHLNNVNASIPKDIFFSVV